MSELRTYLGDRAGELEAVLPRGIEIDEFVRHVLTACRREPKLLGADRASFFTACLQSAADGLLPDGREAALVIYKGKVAYIPMIAGLRKKVRQSKEIATWDAHVAYEGDEFFYELGDEPRIMHRPALNKRGKPIAVYSIATTREGFKSRDVMGVDDVERVRSMAAYPDSPAWKNHWAEMAKKTVCRRHSKVLPMSSDLDLFVNRNDPHMGPLDIEGPADEDGERRPRKPRLAGQLEQIANGGGKRNKREGEEAEPEPEDGDEDKPPIAEPSPEEQGGEGEAEEARGDPKNPDFQRGARDAEAGVQRCLSAAIRENDDRFAQWKAGWDSYAPREQAEDVEEVANG